MWTEWWAWGAFALILIILEVIAPAFVLLGFAIGAGVLSLLLLIGGPFAAMMMGSLPLMLVVFAVISLVAWLVLRQVFGKPGGGQVKVFEKDINDDV